MSLVSPIPNARVARQGGHEVAPPREPLGSRVSSLMEPAKTAVGALVAFWPLTAVVAFCAALLWAVGYNGSP